MLVQEHQENYTPDEIDMELSDSELAVQEEELQEDFGDLESLLAESVKLAAARKAKQMNKKLTTAQVIALDDARIIQEAARWDTLLTFRHDIIEECKCGSVHVALGGYFEIKRERRLHTTRMLRVGRPETTTHSFMQKIELAECPMCVTQDDLTVVTIEEFPIIASLKGV